MNRTLLSLSVLVPLFVAGCAADRSPRPAEERASAPAAELVVLDERPRSGPRVLAIVAHPDDESAFAATFFKLATHLDARCDLLTITNGEGGFKYSTLAERLYGLELTEEAVGRAHLPAIRRDELLEACGYLDVASVHFLMETDHRYTQDANEVLGADAGVWDLERVGRAIARRLADGDYDFVFTLAPSRTTHGHHKAATILAVRAVQALPAGKRPVILCASPRAPEDSPEPVALEALDDFPETRTRGPVFSFDRRQPFGYRERLDYQIVVNWLIAAHKSQGTMQLAMNRAGVEDFRLFDCNDANAEERARALFERLAEPQFESKEYGPSAGVQK